jgi:hypothetical protein
MSKQKSSKLDQFAEALLEMDSEKKTLAEMVTWLRDEGVAVSSGRLSEFLSSLRQQQLEQQLFGLIASGGRMNKELESAYKENPAPDLDRLITVTKSLVMSLQVKGAADPKLLNLANSMQQTVLSYVQGKTKAEIDLKKLSIADRRTKLMEQKAAAYDRAQAALADAKTNKGGITAETLKKIESELRLL